MILQPITVLDMNSFWGNFAGIRPLFRDLTALRGYDGGDEGGKGGECSADGGESVFVTPPVEYDNHAVVEVRSKEGRGGNVLFFVVFSVVVRQPVL